MDWRMPGMSGVAAARAIKSDAEGLAPAVIMVTAFGREDVRQEAEDAGLDGFLVKPVSASSLVDAIMRVFAPELTTEQPAGVRECHYGIEGMKILLAEDNEINQQIAVELLEAVGAEIEVVPDGEQAVRRVREERYDAVLMDLQMPKLDGFAATRAIRCDDRFAGLPIIAMTAHAMAEERERCFSAGMNDHVSKPIEPQVLYRTLARWFRPATKTMPRAGVRPAPPEAGGDSQIPVVAGVDTASGLRRVAGNRRLYLNLLRKYSEGQSGTADAIKLALKRGDRELAERLAHSLKGVSGNIGAQAVQESAAEVERAVRTGADASASIASMEAELDLVLESLRGALSLEEPTAAASSASAEDMREVLGKLDTYLADSDAEALEYLSEHGPVLRAALGQQCLGELSKAIDDFDFQTARQKLRTVMTA
jgi:two-component system sensor histidine kinase/response regulator